MQWYYSKNGTQLGPISEGDLRSKLASGEISFMDLVWKEGMTDWLPAAKVAALAPQPPVSSGAPPVPPVSGDMVNTPYSPPMSQPSSPAGYGPNIPNYLWQSIVVTIFCCWPFGIPAIVYAAKVDGLKSRGDIAGAMAASASAKTWCMVAGGIGLCAIVLWVLFVGVAAVSNQ